MLDSSRLRYLLSRDFNVSPDNISTFVIGEHGDSQVVLWSKTHIAGLSVEEFAQSNNITLEEDYFKKLEDEVRQTAFDVWEMKGPNAYCVATAISEVTRAIVRNESLILPVSSLVESMMKSTSVYPASLIVSIKTITIPMNENEERV